MGGGSTGDPRRAFLDSVMQGTDRLRDISAAKREGYTRITGGDGAQIHVANDAYFRDGRALDPSRPEVLIYRQNADSTFTLLGAMFQQEAGVAFHNQLGLRTHDHGHGDTSTHVWFAPDNLAVAFGDREDPPDELMGSRAYSAGAQWRNDGMQHIRASFQAA